MLSRSACPCAQFMLNMLKKGRSERCPAALPGAGPWMQLLLCPPVDNPRNTIDYSLTVECYEVNCRNCYSASFLREDDLCLGNQVLSNTYRCIDTPQACQIMDGTQSNNLCGVYVRQPSSQTLGKKMCCSCWPGRACL